MESMAHPPLSLLKFDAAIHAAVWVFDKQEEQGKKTDHEDADDRGQSSPQRRAAFDDVDRSAARTDELAHHWPNRRVRLLLLIVDRRIRLSVCRRVRRRHRRDVARARV